MKKTRLFHYLTLLTFSVFIVFAVGTTDQDSSSDGTSTSTSTESSESSEPDLEVIETNYVAEKYSSYITGKVKNNTDNEYSYAQVSFNLYDSDGAQIGTAMANVNNLEPGGVWKFKAIITEDNVDKYKLKEVTGY